MHPVFEKNPIIWFQEKRKMILSIHTEFIPALESDESGGCQ